MGLDRYAFINDEVVIYAGPGVRNWTGSGEYSPAGGPSEEWPDVTQFGLNPRIGIYTRLGSSFGLFAYVGHVIGFNSADDLGGREHVVDEQPRRLGGAGRRLLIGRTESRSRARGERSRGSSAFIPQALTAGRGVLA